MTVSLAQQHDVALLDLDGVVYAGAAAVPHAVPSLRAAASAGMRLAYVTNNASRAPEVVADHLRGLGLSVSPGDVVTSAQAGARLLAALVPVGRRCWRWAARGWSRPSRNEDCTRSDRPTTPRPR